ncbi:MAG: hypothetical protein CMI08_16290 [Oceanospirillaceae bacterium]|nr:hypothetical protein [Oceanospirillaceae bacterium]MAY00726.1 hypothetical protein [Oceanospirillaceae bacterium]MBS51298.1 hypothetical protein [Oceanospirillaceae bacterium]
MEAKSLAKKTSIIAASELISKLINFASFALLAVWLVPEDYGVFAIAWMAFVAADAFFDLGGGVGFFREEITKNSQSLFNGYILIVASVWVLVQLSLSYVFYLFDRTDVATLVLILAVSLIPRLGIAAATGWWKVNFQTEKMAVLQCVVAIAGAVAAVVSASLGLAFESLAIRFLIGNVTGFFLVLLMQPGLLNYQFDFSVYRRWVGEGFKYSLTTNWGWLVFYYIEQQTILLVFGTASLGIYNYAKKAIEVAMQSMGAVSRTILVPYFIRYSIKLSGVRSKTLIGAIGIVILISIMVPMMHYFERFLSSQWQPIIELISILLYILPANVVFVVLSSYLVANKKYRSFILMEVFNSLLLAFVGLLVYQYDMSISDFCYFMVAVYMLKSVVLLGYLSGRKFRQLDL